MMKKSEVKSSLLLLLTAFIWGVAFVAQSMGLDYVEAMTFNGCRFLLGGTVLLPVIYFRKKRQLKQAPDEGQKENREKSLWWAVSAVVWLCVQLPVCSNTGFNILL